MALIERRAAPRVETNLLASYRDSACASAAGFVRTLNLSETGALIESADPFYVGQTLRLEFLLDYDRVAKVEGRVTRVTRVAEFYRAGIAFVNVAPHMQRLLARQVSP